MKAIDKFPGEQPGPALQHVAEVMRKRGLTIHQFLALAKRDYGSLFGRKGAFVKTTEPPRLHTLAHVQLFHFILKIRPEKLLLDPEEEQRCITRMINRELRKTERTDEAVAKAVAAIHKKYLTRDRWEEIRKNWQKKSTWEHFFPLENMSPSNHEPLVAAYDTIKLYIDQAKRTIDAHEWLYKGNGELNNQYQAYKKPQTEYYQTIIDRVKRARDEEKDFRYTRTFYLSASERLIHKNKSTYLQALMTEIPLYGLEHIIECQREFTDEHCRFYVVGEAFSVRQRVLVDNQYLLLEDYVFEGRSTYPEMVSVYDLSPKTRDGPAMLKFIHRSIDKLGGQRQIPIHVKDLEMSIAQALSHARNEEKVRDEAIAKLKDNRFHDLCGRLRDTRDRFHLQAKSLEIKLNRVRELLA